jgi:biopolymer transport protein TolR
MRRRIRDDEETGELNIVPYLDVVVNLVMFMLLSMTGLITLGVLNVSAPKIGGDAGATGAAAQQGPRLLLTVAIGKQGFYIAGAGGVLGSDANASDLSRPPTVARKPDGKYDYAELSRQLATIKEKFPDETQVILTAEETTAYEDLIHTMDACRELVVKNGDQSEHKKLFFDVSLSVIG